MTYSIGDVAKMLDITTSTIRYYDKKGLFLRINRTAGGTRIFNDFDISWLKMIEALKTADMSIDEIQEYVKLYAMGDEKLQERYDIVLKRKNIVEQQMKELQNSLEVLNFKCWYYKTAIEAGNAKAVHEKMINNDLPEDILKYHKEHKTPVPLGPLYDLFDIKELTK